MRKLVDKGKRVNIIFTKEAIRGLEMLSKETGAPVSELVRRSVIEYTHKKLGIPCQANSI
jgi:hypothetical protein